MSPLSKLYRYQLAWGTAGTIAGLFGLFHSRGLSFTSARGAETGLPHYELHWMTYNRLGALVAVGLAALGAVAGATRKPALAGIAAAGFALVGLQTLVQWRTGHGDNLLGSTGPTLGFSVALMLAFAITALLAGPLSAIEYDEPSRE